jgi:hypothetical protein
MKRNNSLPAEKMDILPEISKKENLIQIAHQIYDNKQRIAGGLANNIYNERKRSFLATIEENVPASREQERENYLNPRSA